MVSIYPLNSTDFSANGQCVLSPSSCIVTETLNGDWELSLTHPMDDQGKYAWLQVGSILKAPVPAGTSPRTRILATSEGKEIYRVNTGSARLKLYSKPSGSSVCLDKYANATEVQVLSKSNPTYYEVVVPDGKRGYLASASLLYIRTAASNALATKEVVTPGQHRDQPFRIYRIVPELTQVSAYARHLSYDLMDNMIYSYKPANGTSGAAAAAGILGSCQTSHPFSMFSNITQGIEDLAIENGNPLDALLGEGGLADKAGGELVRDWYDLYLLQRVGRDTDLQIRQGKNLLGIRYDMDDANVTTRIVPTGETEEGAILYLDEKYLDSANIGAYPHPRWAHLPVSEARVSDDMTLAQVSTKLRQAAQAEYSKGCDLPDISIDVSFINLDDTLEYAQYRPLIHIFLGDGVRVVVKTLGLEVGLRMTEYSFDCVLRRYIKMTLGTASKTMAGSMISPRQLPAGGIKGMKLAMGAIGTGHLQTASIGSLQVKTAAIGAAHIQQAAIGEAHIENAAITSAKIIDAAITTAKIQDGTIVNAKIYSGEANELKILSANIAQGAIQTANIDDAAVTNAKIGTAAITSAKIDALAVQTAHIADLNVTTGKIADAAISSAKIDDLAVTNAKIGQAAIDTANIVNGAITNAQIYSGTANELKILSANIADAAITDAKIADAAITSAKIADATITSVNIQNGAIEAIDIKDAAIESAKIRDLAVTTGKIANLAVDGAKIADLAVNNAKIADLAVTNAKIYSGDAEELKIEEANIAIAAIKTAHIMDGVITSAKIYSGAIEELKVGSANISSAAIGETHIQDGVITNVKIYSGDAENLKIQSANISNGSITNALIAAGAVGTAQIADGSITDAKIVELTANKINAGELSVERLVISGNDQSIVYALNNMGMLTSQSIDSLDGDTLTPRSITADKIVADSITGNEIAARSITGNEILANSITGDEIAAGSITASNIQAGAITTSKISADFASSLDLSSNNSINTKVTSLQAVIDGKADNTALSEYIKSDDIVGLVQSEINQTASSISSRFTTLERTVNGIDAGEGNLVGGILNDFNAFRTKVESWQEFSPDGMRIGRSDSPYQVLLTNTELQFLQDGSKIAYISNNKLYITASEIVNQFVIGNDAEGFITLDVMDGGLTATWRSEG